MIAYPNDRSGRLLDLNGSSSNTRTSDDVPIRTAKSRIADSRQVGRRAFARRTKTAAGALQGLALENPMPRQDTNGILIVTTDIGRPERMLLFPAHS